MGLFPEVLPVPAAEKGCAKVVIDTPDAFDRLRGNLRGQSLGKERYWRLLVNGSLQMTNAEYEERTNREVIWRAEGDVLIAGLGIGLILGPILAKPEVKSVLVIEKYQDVIDLVAPFYANPKLTVICADIFNWQPPKGKKWDSIYFDIWPDICVDNLEEMAILHKRYNSRRKGKKWMASWDRDKLKRLHRNDKNGILKRERYG